ncbi:ATP-binding cassette domain-containing protein [Acetobacter sp. AN02]|uniref:ABC transporter ATP-binding protein/permease n=1 Tax=Acetobacter sp. AN02 TaxID=2894186 RepID=UPI00243454D6|nr:ATP-binding cassette domain-containing protein [Acetobacter sp. AN02]MDG6093983.1 ATP-binding cassette domain-containing protein [Acetobacter sp. AN02]
MSDTKAAIRLWTKAQMRLGFRAGSPVILISMVSALLGAGQMWCLASVLGPVLARTMAGGGAEPEAGMADGVPLWGVAGFAVCALLRVVAGIVSEGLAARAGEVARRRLRRDVMGRVVAHGPALLRRSHSGAFAALIVDRIEAADGYFSRWVPASVLWMAIPALLLVCAFAVQPFAALILLVCGAAVPVCQAVFGIGAAVASRNQFLAMTRLQARFLDRIRGIATIVLAGRAEDEARRLAEAASDLRVRTMKILRVAFLSSASIDVAMVVALIGIALADAHGVSGIQAMISAHPDHVAAPAAAVTRGMFVLLLVPEYFAPFRGLALAYQDRAHAQGLASSVLELPELAEREAGAPLQSVGPEGVSVAFEDVSFTWDPARGQALSDVSFAVPAGQALILSGVSGSGKSTVMELLLGFVRPGSGRVLFSGTDLRDIAPDSLARMTSWIGQRPVLFAGTLRENVLFARPEATEAELFTALRAAAVDRFLPSLPDGLDTPVGEGGFGLSGGQAQRVAIARAWLKDAPLLLLDEPTAHLDPATEADVFESLRRLAARRTVIMATHSGAAEAISGHRVVLSGGCVVRGSEV